MADINRRGPDILGSVPRFSSLTALSVRSYLDNEKLLIDSSPETNFNKGHVPCSCPIPDGNSMAIWVGWVVTWEKPLALHSTDA